MPSATWMYSSESPVPVGLDPAKYLVTIGVERRDEQALTPADIQEIEAAFAAEAAAHKRSPKAEPLPELPEARHGWLPLSPGLPGVHVAWKDGIPYRISVEGKIPSDDTIKEIYKEIETASEHWAVIGGWHLLPFRTAVPEPTATLVSFDTQPTHRVTFTPSGPFSEKELGETYLVYCDTCGPKGAWFPAYRHAEWMKDAAPLLYMRDDATIQGEPADVSNFKVERLLPRR